MPQGVRKTLPRGRPRPPPRLHGLRAVQEGELPEQALATGPLVIPIADPANPASILGTAGTSLCLA